MFGGLSGQQPWESFLLELRAGLDAEFATLILTPPGASRPGQILTPGAPAVEIDRYAEDFFRDDPFTGLPEGRVVAYDDFLGPRAKEDSDYNRWLAGHSGEVLGVDIRSRSGFEARLRVTRTRRGASYTGEEAAALQRLVPHLRNALELYQALEANRSEHAVYSGAIEQLSVGVAVLDHAGRIVSSNAVADAILAQRDGLARAGTEFRFAAAAHRATLERLLAGPATTQPGPLAILRVERPSGRRDYGVAVHRMALPAYMRTGSSPALVLLISDPERPALADTGSLRARFGLTRKEAQLAGELAAGLSLDEAAARLGIARNTARSHLRGLFAKAGVSRQGELVRLIHASLPGLGGRN